MITLKDSIEIKETPERVFNWLTNFRTDEDYQAWHPDHVKWQWVKGEPFQRGSVVLFEEYIHGELHRFKFVCIKVVPNRLIEYKSSFPWSIFMPKSKFIIVTRGGKGCVFTATISFRGHPLFRKIFERQIEATKQHMKEKGENLKRILESKEFS